MPDIKNTNNQTTVFNTNTENNHHSHSSHHSSEHHSHSHRSSHSHSHSSRKHKKSKLDKLRLLKHKIKKLLKSKKGLKTIISCVIILLLVGVFAGLIYQNNLVDKVANSNYSALSKQAKPYEDELKNIRKEMAKTKSSLGYVDELSNIIIGFNMSSTDDLQTILSYATRYKIKPTIILDCDKGLATLDNLLDCLKYTGYDIILTGKNYDDYTSEVASTVRKKLSKYSLVDTKLFLLQRDMNTTANLERLFYDGYRGYTVYSTQEILSGIDDKGLAYITYSNISKVNYSMTDKIKYFISGREPALFIFELSALTKGTMSEDTIKLSLECLKEYEKAGQIIFSNATDTIKELVKLKDSAVKSTADYYKYEEEQNARIKELQQIIRNIYNGNNSNAE